MVTIQPQSQEGSKEHKKTSLRIIFKVKRKTPWN